MKNLLRVHSTSYFSLRDFLDLYKEGKINLQPYYQDAPDRWKNKPQLKQDLIRDILAPKNNIAYNLMICLNIQNNKYDLLDGLQKVAAINEFIDGKIGLNFYDDKKKTKVIKTVYFKDLSPEELNTLYTTTVTFPDYVLNLTQKDAEIYFRSNLNGVRVSNAVRRNSFKTVFSEEINRLATTYKNNMILKSKAIEIIEALYINIHSYESSKSFTTFSEANVKKFRETFTDKLPTVSIPVETIYSNLMSLNFRTKHPIIEIVDLGILMYTSSTEDYKKLYDKFCLVLSDIKKTSSKFRILRFNKFKTTKATLTRHNLYMEEIKNILPTPQQTPSKLYKLTS